MSGNDDDDTAVVRVASLHVYPIKSCGGIALGEALLTGTGFDLDRAWMVLDANGAFMTQRTLPRMALIQPTLKSTEMVLRAPGMLALHVALDRVEQPCRATIWGDEVAAFDMGDLCAQWFSDFLAAPEPGAGRDAARFPLRLVRFDPDQRRLSNPRWTGAIEAENAFSDGFPILVAGDTSVAELNRRLGLRGEAPVTLARFRPNLVLEGLDAHGEDAVDDIEFAGAGGPVRLKLVKPCSRCPIPDVDPVTARVGHAVGDALAGYRADARMGGALTFGMNAVIVEGFGQVLRAGAVGRARWRFD